MADKKEKKEECPHYKRWPLGVGAALVIILLGGLAESKTASAPRSGSASGPGIAQPIPVYADRWVEIPVNPRTESGYLDIRRTRGLKFLVTTDNDIAHAVTMSETSSQGLGDGRTNVLIQIAPHQGVAYTQVKFIRIPKSVQ